MSLRGSLRGTMRAIAALALLSSAPVALAQTVSPSNSSQSTASAPPDGEPIQASQAFSTPYYTRINLTALTPEAWTRISTIVSNSPVEQVTCAIRTAANR